MGGIEQVIDQIARGSVSHGIDTDVLSLTSQQTPNLVKVNGYLVYKAKIDIEVASTSMSLSSFFKFVQLAKKADVIHYHFPWPFMDLVHFVARIKKPTLVTYHSDIIRQKKLLMLYRPLMNLFLASVGRIVVTSPNYKKSSKTLRRFVSKVVVVPIGLDKSTYPQPNASRLKYWEQHLGSKFFLFVGVLRYYKGLHILIEALKGVDYPVVIAGTGPVEQKLKELAACYGLRNIYFLGYVSDEDKVVLLTLCYSVIFPSHLRSEAFGISLLEGAMFGKPMISSEIGTGTTFINIDGETGIAVPPSDPHALCKAMEYLWDNPVLAAKMGVRAEKRYWKYFTSDKMVSAYVDLYGKLNKLKS